MTEYEIECPLCDRVATDVPGAIGWTQCSACGDWFCIGERPRAKWRVSIETWNGKRQHWNYAMHSEYNSEAEFQRAWDEACRLAGESDSPVALSAVRYADNVRRHEKFGSKQFLDEQRQCYEVVLKTLKASLENANA